MPTFQAKERELAQPGKPGDKVPEAAQDGMMFMGDGRFYLYRHDQHTERDLFRPGYFDSVIDKNAGQYHGALILYTAGNGKTDPAEWSTGFLRVTQVRGTRGIDGAKRSQVAIVVRFHKATAVGHDGVDETTSGDKAA